MFRTLSARVCSFNVFLSRCNSTQLPKITVPVHLQEDDFKNLEKKYRQRNDKKFRGDLFISGDRRIPVITSKMRPNLNHYYNQRYRKRSHINLASDGWQRGIKYDGDIITFEAFEANPAYQRLMNRGKRSRFDPVAITFESLGIRPELCKNLKELFKAEEPNEVQVITIPKIMSGINVRCCFETGTGKTIAYILPLIERMLREKEAGRMTNSTDVHSELREPAALIVVPSRELGYQTAETIHKLTRGLNIGVAPILGGKPLHLPHTGYDIVITTLGMFQSNLKNGIYSLDKIKHVIVDEVDTMCDSSFKSDVSALFNKFSFANPDHPNATQLILVSATFPQYVYNVVGDFIDLKNIDVATSKKVNHLLFHMKHVFYRINRAVRPNKLLDLCYKFEKDPGQTMIFVNRKPVAVFISKFLNSHDVDCTMFVKSKGDRRFHNFLEFQEGRMQFMVSTDLGSRGLDTKNVQHIINFDCPRFTPDYVHRAGRTGRINNTIKNCSVHSFVSFKPDVQLVQQLERSIREDRELEGIEMDIKDFYKTKYADNEALADYDDEFEGDAFN